MYTRLILEQPLVDEGTWKILCQHAHSNNARLRLDSLWALKHLIHKSPNEFKMTVVEELGPGWLKRIVCSDNDESPRTNRRKVDEDMGGTPIAMNTPNSAGQQVDLLNPVDYPRPTSQDSDQDDTTMADSIGALSEQPPPPTHTSRPTSSSQLPPPDKNLADRTRRDEQAVQEQALDFMRNLICGEGAAEMIDYLFRELGQDKVFEILLTKLRRASASSSPSAVPFSSSTSSSTSSINPAASTELLISVTYFLVHLAASTSARHRQLLISQTELLKLMIPLCQHSNRLIRQGCAWMIINLTWIQDQGDRESTVARCLELRKLGFVRELERMEGDSDLDTRERARVGLSQVREVLR